MHRRPNAAVLMIRATKEVAMFRTAILATVVVAIGAAAGLGANQRRGANQPGQPDFQTGTAAVTIVNEPGVSVINQPSVTIANEPSVGGATGGPLDGQSIRPAGPGLDDARIPAGRRHLHVHLAGRRVGGAPHRGRPQQRLGTGRHRRRPRQVAQLVDGGEHRGVVDPLTLTPRGDSQLRGVDGLDDRLGRRDLGVAGCSCHRDE